jgi:hydrogenase maturation protease
MQANSTGVSQNLLDEPSRGFQIIGYGNPQRQDDGIGPYVIDRLSTVLKSVDGIHLQKLPQLEPAIVDELQRADRIIFVDATLLEVHGGWRLDPLRPALGIWPPTTHHFTPMFILGLLQALYHCNPPSWLASVQGYNYGFGCGITPRAKTSAERAITAILALVHENSLQTGGHLS